MSINPEFIRALRESDKTGLAVYQARANADQVYKRFSTLAEAFKSSSAAERGYHHVLNELARATADDTQALEPISAHEKLRLVTRTLINVLQGYPDRVGELFEDYQPIFSTNIKELPFPDDINLGAYATKFEPMIILVLESKSKGERQPVNYAQIMDLLAKSRAKTAPKHK